MTSLKIMIKYLISITNNKDVNRVRFKLSNVPNDFLACPEIARKVNETIERIENSLRVSENVQSAFDDFQTFVHDEINSRLPKTIFQNGINKRKKSLYKPYWNNELTEQWDLACFTKKKWLKFQEPKHVKLKYKSDFHEARKTFDGLNRRKKRKYITEEQRKLEKLLDSQNKTHFWKSIGKVGIVNDRKLNIPWAITD